MTMFKYEAYTLDREGHWGEATHRFTTKEAADRFAAAMAQRGYTVFCHPIKEGNDNVPG